MEWSEEATAPCTQGLSANTSLRTPLCVFVCVCKCVGVGAALRGREVGVGSARCKQCTRLWQEMLA